MANEVNQDLKADCDALYVQIGQNVRRIRRTRKMTQGALADHVRLSRTSVTNIEKGRQKILVHTLAELAKALETSFSELVPSPVQEANNGIEARLSHLPETAEKDFVISVMQPQTKTSTKTKK